MFNLILGAVLGFVFYPVLKALLAKLLKKTEEIK